MEPISKKLRPIKLTSRKAGGVNSPFNDAVDRAIKTLQLEGRFSYWCGRFKNIDPQVISYLVGCVKNAKGVKSNGGYLNWTINTYRKENGVKP